MTHLTEREAQRRWCPFAGDRGRFCMASGCAVWLPDPADQRIIIPDDRVDRVIAEWMHEHPPPHGDDEEEWRHWRDQGRKSARFIDAIQPFNPKPPLPPRGSGWTWVTGWDDQRDRPFAHWLHPGEPRGRCGLVHVNP